jgi:hypothetical protein
MECDCGGKTKTLYRVNPENRELRWRAEQCVACGREVRWLVAELPENIYNQELQHESR